MPIGTNVEGKMVAALRRLGFDSVFDVDTAADLTIMEEGDRVPRSSEKRRQACRSSLPARPDGSNSASIIIRNSFDNLSSCKSPQQMFGALMKTYYAEKEGLDPKDIFVVSIMPCTAKKFEISRDNQNAVRLSGY